MYCGNKVILQEVINQKVTVNEPQKKIRNITFARGSTLVSSFRNFHISINGVEKVVLADGLSKSIQLEDGVYSLRASIAGYSMTVPLNVNKDTVVCINFNNKDRKWEIVTN